MSREDIFITTKLWCNAHHTDDVAPALDASLADLGVDYIDLYLMHYPCAFKRGADFLPVGPDKKMISGDTPFIETWRAMEKLLATGRTKAIGVSNFSQHELDVILKEGSVVRYSASLVSSYLLADETRFPQHTKWSYILTYNSLIL